MPAFLLFLYLNVTKYLFYFSSLFLLQRKCKMLEERKMDIDEQIDK